MLVRMATLFLCGIFLCSITAAQPGLTPVEDSTMVAETEIFEDQQGNIWADLVKVQFIGHVAVVNPGIRTFDISDISPSFPDVIDLLDTLEVNNGLSHLEKVLPDAVYGDTLRANVRTGQLVPVSEYSQLVNLRFDEPVYVDSIAAVLETLSAVRYAEGPSISYLLGDPDDEHYAQQWELLMVDAQWAWDLTKGDVDGEPVHIAVADLLYCAYTEGGKLHMDLRGRLTMRNDCSEDWWPPGTMGDVGERNHGIHVASVAGAITNNGTQPAQWDNGSPHPTIVTGMASVGWNVLIDGYAGLGQGMVDAAVESDALFRVANASFLNGGTDLRNAVKDLLRRDVVVVGGAGNVSANPYPARPAAYTWKDFEMEGQQQDLIGKQVIAAAGVDAHDTIITCYNYSPCGDIGQPACDPLNPSEEDESFVDVAAPAFGAETGRTCTYPVNTGITTALSTVDWPDTDPNTTFHENTFNNAGTSFASPMVSAVAALILSVNPDLGPREVYEAITQGADKVDPAGAIILHSPTGTPGADGLGMVGSMPIELSSMRSKHGAVRSVVQTIRLRSMNRLIWLRGWN